MLAKAIVEPRFKSKNVGGIPIKYPQTNVALNFVLILGMLASILPLLIVISVSLSSETTILREGYGLFPKDFTLDTYKFAFSDPRSIVNAYKVTIYTTVVATAICLANVALFAYPLSRPDFRFRTEITFLCSLPCYLVVDWSHIIF